MNRYLNLINPTAEDIKVIGRVVSVANDGVVASAYQIWDEYLHMWQGEINKFLYDYVNNHESEIGRMNDDLQDIYDQLNKIKLGGISDIVVNGENMRKNNELVVDLGTVIRDLSDYYNKDEVNNIVDRLPKLQFLKLEQLPEDPSEYIENIVLIPANPGDEDDWYDEYIVQVEEIEAPDGNLRMSYLWEKVGSTRIDLSDYVQVDSTGKIPNGLIPKLTLDKLPLGSLSLSGKTSLQDLFILLSQKGAANGVATLDSVGKVLASQLNMPWKGDFTGNFLAMDIAPGVYGINNRKIGPNPLGGENGHGVMLVFPDVHRTTIIVAGRPHTSQNSTVPEIYIRRYITQTNSWTGWLIVSKDKLVSYTLSKNGSNIVLTGSDGSTSSVADSNTTYTTMTSAQISAGTSTTGNVISAKVLKDELNKKVNVEEGKGLSTNNFDNKYKQQLDYLDCVYPVRIYYNGDLFVSDKPIDLILAARDSGKAVIAIDETNNGRGGVFNYYLAIDSVDDCTFIELYALTLHSINWRILHIKNDGSIDRRTLEIPLSGGSANLSNYYTKSESDAKYLTEHQDISGKANQSDLLALDQRVTNNIVWVENYVRAGVDGVLSEIDSRGYLTEHQDISGKANISDLATVATSGSYNDLSNKPLNLVQDANYVHTDNNYTNSHKSIVLSLLDETYDGAINGLWCRGDLLSNQISLGHYCVEDPLDENYEIMAVPTIGQINSKFDQINNKIKKNIVHVDNPEDPSSFMYSYTLNSGNIYVLDTPTLSRDLCFNISSMEIGETIDVYYQYKQGETVNTLGIAFTNGQSSPQESNDLVDKPYPTINHLRITNVGGTLGNMSNVRLGYIAELL